MTGPRRLPSGFAVRTLSVLLSAAFLAAAFAAPPRAPEDEDPAAKPVTHKVTVNDPDEPAAKSPSAPRAIDLAQAARDRKHFAVKKLFRDLAVPHDILKYQTGKIRQQNILPIPDFIGDKPQTIVEPFEVTPLAADTWQPEKPIQVKKYLIDSIKPYEQLALDEVGIFLGDNYEKSADPNLFLSRYDQDVAAEQALTTVLLHMQSELQRGGRRGEAWPPIEEKLKQKLLGVLLEELKTLAEGDDWDAAFALTQRLAASYRTPEDQKRIADPLGALVKQNLARSLDEKQKAESRRRLRQLEELFPDNPAIRPVSEALRKQAQELFDEAKREMAAGGKNPQQVGRLLNEAEDAWPALPELRAYRIKLGNDHPTLRVGVRELPARLSPALAVTDSDRRAVELLFESLVKLSPDGDGGSRWTPGLAQGRPEMTARGRRFTLPANTFWSNHDPLTAVDVRFTVDAMAKGQGSGRPPVWADLIEQPVVVVEPTRFDLTLSQGWLDPLAPMNFKVLPAGSDADSPRPDSEKFAEHPLGSGPYMLAENIRTDKESGDRPCVAFTINPYYGARPRKAGLPRIEEIHFIAYKDPAAELEAKGAGRLDLLLDLTAKDEAALRAKAGDLNIQFPDRTAPNRRIYFLAVNHGRPALANANFRLALAYAVNREKLLDDDFRATPGQNLHTSLNGPYPAKSWACNPGLTMRREDKVILDPFNLESARAKKALSGVKDEALTLKYPAGDAAVAKAMTELCAQVKDALGVSLTAEALPPAELRHAVETHNYDLAYYHYDFPDDVYWLGPLLDPRGENYLGYNGPLNALMQDASRRRDFPEVRKWTHNLHDKFLNEEMPFIPLWQLEPLAAVHNDVRTSALEPAPPPTFDPLLVFTDVEQWKLKRK